MVKYYYTEVPDSESFPSDSPNFPPSSCCNIKPCDRPRPNCFQKCCNWGWASGMSALATFIFLTWLLSLPPCGPTASSLTDTTPFLGFLPFYTNVCNADITSSTGAVIPCTGAYDISITIVPADIFFTFTFPTIAIPTVAGLFPWGYPITGSTGDVDLGTFTPVTLYEAYVAGVIGLPTCFSIFAP